MIPAITRRNPPARQGRCRNPGPGRRRSPASRLAVASGVLALTLAAAACGSSGGDGSSSGLRGAPIKVMGIGGYTVSDPLAFLETDLQASAAAVNRAGGIHGHPLQMLICDDNGDPNKNLACSRQAVSEHVAAVITTDADTIAGLPILKAAGIPVISTLGFWNQELTSRYVFPINGGGSRGGGGQRGSAGQRGTRPPDRDRLCRSARWPAVRAGRSRSAEAAGNHLRADGPDE
jgi:Periplasmic binding protein